MSLLLFDISTLGLAISFGIISGWWLQFWFNFSRNQTSQANNQQVRERERQHTKDAMLKLQTLAANVAVQVGQHNERVQEINSELTAVDSQCPESVMAAVTRLVEANARMHEQLGLAERRLAEQAREIESHVSEARTDSLTQIHNRRAFDEEMRKCVDEFKTHGRSSSVMMLDVDFFKNFNDTHGHKAGDEILKTVANKLKSSLASSEIVCRYGGEEFTVIFPGSTLSVARGFAERARSVIGATSIPFEGKTLSVTASAGLAEFRPNESIESVVKRADDALYVSKRDGRDCGHYHDGVNFVRFVPRNVPEPVAVEASEPSQPVATPATPMPAEVQVRQSLLDPVTGLSNRTSFFDDVNRRMSEWKRGDSPISIVFMQIDDYQEIGGTNGAKARHLVLRAATQFLRATMRHMDHIARYDDNTFSILMPTASMASAIGITERLRRSVARCKLPFEGTVLKFTVTFGVGEAMQGDSASRLLQRSKIALDAAVDAGGGTSYVHTGEQVVCADDYFANGDTCSRLAGTAN